MNRHRDGAIDELRGIAFLAVLASHVGLVYGLDLDLAYAMAIPALGVGVDLFFVISGYVIARNVLELRERAGGDVVVSTAAFWMRRFVRIGPPLWATAATVAAFRLALAPAGSLADLVAGAGFYANFYWAECMTAGSPCPSPLIASHFWSLALEMQFYVLAPFVVGMRRPLAAACLAGVLIVGAAAARPVGGFLWSARPDALLLGVALAMEGARAAAWLGRLPRVGLLQATYWIAVAAVVARISTGALSGLAIVVTAGICAYVVGARLATGASAWQPARWLRKAGKASYAAYLVHLPVLNGVHGALAGRVPPALSLAAALGCVVVATIAADELIVKRAARAARRRSDAWIIKNCKNLRPAYKEIANLLERALMRKLVLVCAMMFLGLAATVKADTYGCTVLLCTAPGAGDWRAIPACVVPVSTALLQAYYGIPWPQCPEAAVSAAQSQTNANNPGSSN